MSKTIENQWFTDHGGEPMNDKEWATNDFGYGAYFAGHGIGLEELCEDWPEIANNAQCMKGYLSDRT
jgi:hypothetical protein